MISLSAREQRLIAVLILVTIVALLWWGLVAPTIDGFAARRELRLQLAASVERNGRLIAAMPDLRRQLERQRPDRLRFSLAAESSQAAGDLLRQRLQRSVEQVGGSVSALGDSAVRDHWVGASAEGTVTLGQLTQLLVAVQNQQPYLVVTGLTVVADRAFQSGKLDIMNVKIDVAIPYN